MQYDAQLQLTAYKWALIWLNHGLIADKWSGLNEVSRSTHPILSGGVELHCLTSFILLLIEKSLSLCLRMVSHSFTRLVLDFYDLLWKTVPDSYCWQTSFIIWSHLSPTGEHTCFAGIATVNRSPHQHSSRRWLEAPTESSTKKLAATSGRRHWTICWSVGDARIAGQDHSMWRTLQPSASQAQQWVSEWYKLNFS